MNTLIDRLHKLLGMKLLLAIAPERFRDEELEIPMGVFKESGIDFDIASTATGTCMGMLGVTVEACRTFEEADPDDYAGIVIVGGIGSQDYLWTNERLIDLVRSFFEQGKVVAAICLSPVVLARAGILAGRQATVYPTPASVKEMQKGGAHLLTIPVVADMQIVTANGPGAAEEFANTIVTKLEC
jgi:protease I